MGLRILSEKTEYEIQNKGNKEEAYDKGFELVIAIFSFNIYFPSFIY